MQRVSSEEVVNDLVIGQVGFSNYDSAKKKVKKMSKQEKMKLSLQDDFPKTWTEFFEDEKTEWYKTELLPSTEFINKIFDSGKGFMTYIGQKHSELVQDYKTKKMPKEHRDIIDQIRKRLSNNPRIIVLTKDFKEFCIFDGAKRAIAFTLEKKNLPVYIGKRDSFTSLPYF